ncbi:transposable element Tcb2 transposase [Trichonephila clavipes]|nr:transposable element Tcb2 transposase [Trichonephila clavipes]
MSFTRRPDPGPPRQTSLRKDRHIARNSHVQLTASSATPSSPPIDTSVWSGATQEETGLQWNGTGWSLATNPDSISSSDNNHVRVWRPRVEHLNPAFALQQHTTPIAGVMVWGTIAYNTLASKS